MALMLLSWSADTRYYPLLLEVANERKPDVLPSRDYNAAYYAIVALAEYLPFSLEARRIVEQAAADPDSELARQAGILALAAANDSISRRTLLALPPAYTGTYIVGLRVTRALAHSPCSPGQIFVEWRGVEGQDFSKCELPPDYR